MAVKSRAKHNLHVIVLNILGLTTCAVACFSLATVLLAVAGYFGMAGLTLIPLGAIIGAASLIVMNALADFANELGGWIKK